MVFKVIWGTYCTLYSHVVGRKKREACYLFLDLTSIVINLSHVTVTAGVKPVVRSSNSQEVPDREFGIAALYDIPSNKWALRKTDDVKLHPTKYWMLVHLETGLINLGLDGREYGSDISIADLYALNVALGPMRELLHKILYHKFRTSLFDSVE